MGFQAGTACYATAADAAEAQKWLSGHDTTLLINGVVHLVQYIPVTDGNGTRLQHKVTRLTDGVEIHSNSLTYAPASCGTLDPGDFGLSPELLVKIYGVGFGATLSFFFIGYVIAVATGLVKKA